MIKREGVASAVIGCGNPNRGDDGVGSFVIGLLKEQEQNFPGVRLFDAGTNGMEVMYRARGADSLIIIDAKAPEGSPGAVYEVPGDVLENASEFHYNSHSFRWDHALYTGKKIYRDDFPTTVKVFLIEAGSLAYRVGLTPEVEKSAYQVVEKIRELMVVDQEDEPLDVVGLDSGKIYLNASTVKKYFREVKSVAVIVQGDFLKIFPIYGMGGYLLKVRNSVGDCVISAPDVLHSQGLDAVKQEVTLQWSRETQGLHIKLSKLLESIPVRESHEE